MRKMAFLIFFSIVLIIYGLINWYIYTRAVHALPDGTSIRSVFPYLFWAVALTFVAGRVLEKYYLSGLSDVLVWVGSFWLAAMLYFFLAVLLIDLLRLLNYFVPFFPDIITANYQKTRFVIFISVAIVVVVVVAAGHINALYPVVRKVNVHIDKPANGMQQLKAVVLSDIHLGTLIGKRHLGSIVEKVQELNPDIILLAGDVLDEDLEPVLRENTGETLRKLKAPMGVYSVMGNHEYIGGAEAAYKYLTEHGIHVIRDSLIVVNENFTIIGREDRDKERFSGKKRMAVETLVSKANKNLPVILMDHQPYNPEEAASQGVDLQLSGHTHHGQLWPLNYITSAVFTVDSGYARLGNMHIYVSNGVGTWGPPVRIGNRPEIIYLNITFGN